MSFETVIKDSLLGKETDYSSQYDVRLLFPIARAEGRAHLTQTLLASMYGEDRWTHYEISFLNADGKPIVGIGEIRVPADSPFLIESKSLKLYFNSFNFTRMQSLQAFIECVQRDLSAAAQAKVIFDFIRLADAHVLTQIQQPPGQCLDDLPVKEPVFHTQASLLTCNDQVGEAIWHSHLLRSNCPVTQQPDWATVVVDYKGRLLEPESLLAYLISYRSHNGFHEHCVEQIYQDIYACTQPEYLSVYARYTRRGGLDINPFRASKPQEAPCFRLMRQ